MLVLALDDDPTVGTVLTEVLAEFGHAVTAVTTVDAAYDALRATRFDVLILDLLLDHDTTGLDLLRKCLRLRRKPMPRIVLLTGCAKEHAEELLEMEPELKGRLLGPDFRIIWKPPTTQELLDAVEGRP